MGLDQIHHMNIVAQAGAVRGGVIGAMQGQRRPPPGDRIQHQRDQMGLGAVELADLGFGIGTGHVEIAEDDRAQAMGGPEIGQHALDGALAGAIGVQRLLRRVLVQQDAIMIAIGGAGRGKHHIAAAPRHRRLKEVERAADIDPPIPPRLLHRLAHLAEGGEMHHRGGLPSGKDLIQPRPVQKIALLEGAKFHRIGPAGGQIVIGDRHIARRRQKLAGMRADIAGAAGDQDMRHHGLSFTGLRSRFTG